MKLKLKDLKIQSFVVNVNPSNQIKGGAIPPFTVIPCSAIDACPTGYCLPKTTIC